MSRSAGKVHRLRVEALAQEAPMQGGACIGRIVRIDDGRPFVSFDRGTADVAASEGVPARVAIGDLHGHTQETLIGQPVLLLFEGGQAAPPVIVGLVQERLPLPRSAPTGGSTEEARVRLDAGQDVQVNGEHVSLDAQEELVLRCGQASIVLRADGQVVIKGTRLMSRASESNKIRGATVLIN